ncbi:MAG: TIGR02679 domain-containing protein [Defluviitaleaceae bacterium]|nr:TIGR02679 domain-containing protein [Defluviitaleaceae bacterium]
MQEILSFFKSNPAFGRILHAMNDTLTRHGRVFGAATLDSPTQAEEAALSEFFKRDYFNQALIRISLADLERQIQKNFNNDKISLGEVLGAYVGRPLKQRGLPTLDAFAAAVLGEAERLAGTPAEAWLREISSQTRRTYRACAEMFRERPQEAIDMISSLAAALNDTDSSKLIALADFSEKHMGGLRNALNFNEATGTLFTRALACKLGQPMPSTLEEWTLLHYKAGLLSCAMLSSVTAYGILGGQADSRALSKTTPHAESSCVSLTLENLTAHTHISAYKSKVFILQEPLIFSSVLSLLGNCECTVICPTGGFNAAFLHLLRLMHTEDTLFYYAGNFTPKDLAIADKLYVELGKNFVPWRYDKGALPLSSDRFIDIKGQSPPLHNEALATMLSNLHKTGKTVSTMPLVPLYAEDIKISVQ